ncbi:MAG: hypothetical protein DDT23_00693 [candidate division WS2 bacterium]|nr:hypothetical protein [Candidatus Lithacetigena glycinireducens]
MFKQIHHTFWTDPKVKKLSVQEKLLFLYLITNPHSHYSGIYYLPLSLIQEETGLAKKDIQSIMNIFVKDDFIRYDKENNIIWVKNMLKYQLTTKYSETQIKGIANHLGELHNSTLLIPYLTYYDTLSIPYRYPINTLPIPYQYPTDTLSEQTEVYTEVYTEVETEVETKTNMCDFDLFWKTYPKKVNKAYAIKVWNKLKPSQELTNTIISAVEKAKKSVEWRKDKGQFIPHPSTYLNNKRWEDELTMKEEASKYAKYDRGEWEDEFSTNEEEGGKYDKYN